MNIEEERRRILELWHNIKPKAKGDLANLWEEKDELGELDALVEDLEPKVIKLLEVIHTLPRHSHEYHARTRDLVKLLNHFSKYKSSEEWVQKVSSDLYFISTEARKAINEAIRMRSAASRTQTQAKSVDGKKIDSLKILIDKIKKELEELDKVALPFSKVAQEHYEVWQRGDVPPELESKFLSAWQSTATECKKIIYSIPSFFDDLRSLLGSIFGFIPAKRTWIVEDMSSGSAREEFAPNYENEVNHLPEQIRSPYLMVMDLLIQIWKDSWSILHSSSDRPRYDQFLSTHASVINKTKTEIYPQLDVLYAYFSR